MHFIYSVVLVFILLTAHYSYAQDSLSTFAGRPVSSVTTVTDTGITGKDVENECNIKIGELLSLPQVRDCIIHYYNKGLFKDISVEALQEENGVGLWFYFVEKMKVNDIKIRGNDYFSTKKIKAAAGLKKGGELSDEKIAVSKENILKLYKEAGFFNASAVIFAYPKEEGKKSDIVIKIEQKGRAKISDMTFSGYKVFDEAKLRSLLKTGRGDYYSETDMSSGIKKITKYYYEKGYIKALVNTPELIYDRGRDEVSVNLSIDAGPRVEVKFEGATVVSPATLNKELLIWKERAYDTSVIDESADRITELYQQKGYYFVSVSYSVEKPDDRNVHIVFNIKEGKSITIKNIGFIGNSYFKDETLKEYIDIKEGGFLFDDALKAGLKDIAGLYKSNGFLAIRVTYQVLFFEEDDALGIDINIEEGPQTRLSLIRLEGNNSFSMEDIHARIKSRAGRPFNESQIVEDIYNIQSFYLTKGYIYVSVDLRTTFNDDNTYAVVDFIISENNPVYIGKISLTGLSFTKEIVVRRELLIKEDELFSYEKIFRSQRQLQKLGIFKSSKVEILNPDLKEVKKDISVRIEEGNPGRVEFGIGYGDVERLRGMIEGGYRNLFGTGRQITLRAEGSSIEQKLSINYKEPWVLGYQMDGRLNLVDLAENKSSFNRRTFGLSAGLDKGFNEFVTGSLTYQYEDVKLSDVQPEAILTPEDTGKVEVSTINPSLIIDRRDDPFNPSRGYFFSATFREAAKVLGSRPQFAKITVQDSHFFSPVSKLVFALSVRGGVAWNFGESNEVPIFERYFAGGRSTIRGYDQDKFGIPGKTITYDGNSWTPTGGNMMLVLNGELRFPLFKGIGMVVFADGGNVWRKVNEFDVSEIRATAGGGIRYNTPVGPLRLDIGCKLDKEEGEDSCMPHFTLGHAF
ncbi:MAG TPA: outer membrane protein assembly factor BamA [Nitrospirota bacterium]|nr:outer membrane protein assembly factor BamA [Nitrospirota bacterium]